jgi:DNA-binding transcriptional MerR regulator
MTADDTSTRMTIGQLAGRCNVPRTTVLYYEQVGLVAPAGRSEAGYRLYSEQELERVRLICAYRATGLTLDAIRGLLAGGDKPAAIYKRLDDIQRSMLRLREQQALLVELLGGGVLPAVSADSFEGLFKEKGLDDAAMHRWHVVFERQNPEGHRAFLLSLGLSEGEIERIQRDSR